MSLASKAVRVAARGLWAGAAVIAVTVGLGFFTAAVWLALAAGQGAIFASVLVGAGFVTFGAVLAIVLLLSGNSSGASSPSKPESADVVQAFIGGVAQGRAARR